jgi:hypothetical protein
MTLGFFFKYDCLLINYLCVLIENPLYEFKKDQFQVSAVLGKQTYDVESEIDCAFKCRTEADFDCRSFNYCQYGETAGTIKYRCLVSDDNIYNNKKDPSVQYSPLCDHYTSIYRFI